MLDVLFWAVVCYVVWFAWGTREAQRKAQRKALEQQDNRNLQMETINEPRRKDGMGR